MRTHPFRIGPRLGLAALAALSALGAEAAVLPFTGSLELRIAPFGTLAVSGSGTATVNGSGPPGHLTALALAGGELATSGLVEPITDPASFPIAGLQLTVMNAAGAFAGSGGAGFGGAMPLIGTAKVCLFGPCGAAVSNLVVPLTPVGQGGWATVMGPTNLTVVGAPWTTGTVAVGTITAMGGVAPLSNTGAPSGTVTLVTPLFFSTSIGASQVVPAFGILSLHFVPEPGTLALLGGGIAALVAFGNRRRALRGT